MISLFQVVGLLGIGSVLGSYFQLLFQRQKQVKEQEHELKRTRYGCILILMLTRLDSETGLPKARNFRPDLQNVEDVQKEIETELLNGVLFASDEVIKSMSAFIRNPSYSAYIKTATSMRKDLWGKKTSINEEVLNIFKKE